MKRIIGTILAALAASISSAQDIEKTAEQLYQKAPTFSETIRQTRLKYADWAKGQYARLEQLGVSFGEWHATCAISKWRSSLAKIDPNNPKRRFDLSDVWQNEPLWRTIDIVDGQIFDLFALNPYYYNNPCVILHRDIEARQDCKIFITFSCRQTANVYFNGAKIFDSINTGKGIGKEQILALDLKKGKNVLEIKVISGGAKQDASMKFSPFADPAGKIAEFIMRDFKDVAWALRAWTVECSPLVVPALISAKDNSQFFKKYLENMVEASLFSAADIENRLNKIGDASGEDAFNARIALFEDAYFIRKAERALGYDIKNVRAAMEDISKTYPEYDKDGSLFAELKKWEGKWGALKAAARKDGASGEGVAEFNAFAKRALLANPLLAKYPKWVVVRRDLGTRAAGLPQNWQGNTSLTNAVTTDKDGNYKRVVKPHSYKDQLWGFDIQNPSSLKLVYKPEKDTAISDIDISYDGKRVMFSSIDDKSQWNLDEYNVETKKVRELSPRIFPDIDNFDGCYLPDGKIIYCSTATFVGVPCVAGTDYVPNLFVMDPEAGSPEEVDKTIRQLTYEQDADWMPVVMENGRILYTRWEYTDNSHYFARILMHMNPDGTAQSSFYGTTSFWPNSLFYCRQIPGDPNKFVGIVSGHHGIARTGELHLFDISKGKIEDKGRVHKFPSYGRKYEAKILDQLVRGKSPQLIHPFPLSEKYIVCAGKVGEENRFSTDALAHKVEAGGNLVVYLIDAFDNMVPLVDFGDAHAMEPMPLQARPKPQEIMDKTNPDIDYGYVFLNDIYQGDGLKDVPRGTVKALRVIEYFYGYRNTGNHHVIAEEGSWDIKRIHGTVKVEEDGSAFFKAPANRPIAIQPLDKDGNALQLMRSWFTIMPGETQSCVGCHESQGMTPTSKPALASRKPPQEIKPFVGPVRGYSFVRDVQPVLDKYCVGCHDGKKPNRPNFKRGPEVFRTVKNAKGFNQSYLDLMRYVRRSGPESNQHMLSPLEFHTSTSELMQILQKGHKGVVLDKQSMDILRTWMDLNVPFHGVWTEVYDKIPWDDHKRRMWALKKYANRTDDQNAINYDGGIQQYVAPAKAQTNVGKKAPKADGFPFDADAAAKKRDAAGLPKEIVADLGDGVSMRFTLIPAGEFVMGANNRILDEGPARLAKVEKPFYMAQFETTNRQYAAFDPSHDSGHLDRHWKDHVNPGYPANRPEQSVIRVNWNQANEFCEFMSKKFGLKFSLPTETQWEWAARAGSGSDFWFGKASANYGAYENLADYNTIKFAVNGIDPQPVINPSPYIAYIPNDKDVDDGNLIMTEVGQYKPNPFGLYDINGNVSEWTADAYTKTLGGEKIGEKKAVRGGSWRDRAKWSRVSVRRGYEPWQKVYNVGFRVIIEDAEKAAKLFKKAEPLPPYKDRPTTPRENSI